MIGLIVIAIIIAGAVLSNGSGAPSGAMAAANYEAGAVGHPRLTPAAPQATGADYASRNMSFSNPTYDTANAPQSGHPTYVDTANQNRSSSEL